MATDDVLARASVMLLSVEPVQIDSAFALVYDLAAEVRELRRKNDDLRLIAKEQNDLAIRESDGQ